METQRTRRQIVAQSQFERWVARPFLESPLQELSQQEIVVLSKEELLHALYDCDPGGAPQTPPPGGDMYEIVDVVLNVRETPDLTRPPVGQLRPGNRVRAVAHNDTWLRITDGTFANKYIAKRYTRIVNPL